MSAAFSTGSRCGRRVENSLGAGRVRFPERAAVGRLGVPQSELVRMFRIPGDFERDPQFRDGYDYIC